MELLDKIDMMIGEGLDLFSINKRKQEKRFKELEKILSVFRKQKFETENDMIDEAEKIKKMIKEFYDKYQDVGSGFNNLMQIQEKSLVQDLRSIMRKRGIDFDSRY